MMKRRTLPYLQVLVQGRPSKRQGEFAMTGFARSCLCLISLLVGIASIPSCSGNRSSRDAPATAPPAPTGVVASPGDGEATVTWSSVTDATSYNLYLASASGVNPANYGTLPDGARVPGVGSPHPQTGLANGTTYYFVVTSVNAVGESPESAEAQATPLPGLPSPPTGVSAAPGNSEVSLSWGSVAGATAYVLYRATTSGVTKANYAGLPGGTRVTGVGSPHLDSPLSNGTSYYYVVTASNVAGESGESLEVSATPSTGGTSPVTEDATSVTDATARLNGSFTNPSGFTTTIWFEYGTTPTYGSTTPQEAFAAVGPIAVFADLTGLQGSTTYHFRLATQNPGGTFYGGEKTFTTLASPQTLATGLDAPIELRLDSTSVYWVEIYGSATMKVPLGGGLVTTVGSSGMAGNNAALAIDSTDVYWSDWSTVWMTTLSGGPAQTVLTGRPDIFTIYRYGSDLYWWEEWAIMKMDLGTSLTSTIVTGPSLFQGRVALDATGVYWTDIFGGVIETRDHGGGPVVTLAVSLNRPLHLILDSGVLTWTEDTAIRSMPATSGSITDLVTGVDPTALAKDATHVYWADARSEIRKVDIVSSLVTPIVVGESDIMDIEVDGTRIYWLVGGSSFFPPLGSLKRAPK